MSSYVISKPEFVKAYELNVASVNEQYGCNSPADGLDYDSVFAEYVKKGEVVMESFMFWNGSELRELRPRLMSFFHSVLYQIENNEMHKEVAAFFFVCVKILYKDETSDIEGWWGRIDC